MRAIAVREDIRDLILDAAGRLLERFGYTKMSMEDLALEVGVGKGTLYLHFPSKEDVVLSRIDRMASRLLDELRTVAGSGSDAAERLRSMLVLRVLFRFDTARHYGTSMDAMLAAIRGGLMARRERHFALEAEVFAELLESGKREGVFSYAESSTTAEALLLATNSLLPYSLTARQLGQRKAIEEKVQSIATLLIHGIAVQRTQPKKRKP